MSVLELKNYLPVEVVSKTLPTGVQTKTKRGICIALWYDQPNTLFLTVFDDTGEFVWIPSYDIRMQPSWSDGRRYPHYKSNME